MDTLSPPGAGWTDDRVARLTTLWRDGQSAAAVGRVLGVSRNAVIGKVHRLGLSKDGRHASAQMRPPAPARPRKPRRIRAARPSGRPAATSAPPPEPPAELQVGLVPDLAALPAHACRWPIGEPRTAAFAFCGRSAFGDGPYCVWHDAVAHGRPPRAA